MDGKWEEVLDVVSTQLEGCDLKWSLFTSAILSGKPEMCIKPCPPQFLDQHKEIKLDDLRETIHQVPPFQSLPKHPINDRAIELLHWVLIRKPHLRPVAAQDFNSHLKKSLSTKPASQWPQYVFEVLSNPESNAERRFQQHKEQLGETKYAYHGSRLESFYSILNYSLAQHLCKRDLYGEGTYLSTDMDVSLSFSPQGSAWNRSHFLGEHYSCLALCEYVPSPMYIRNNPKKIPIGYIILTNNEILRVRYLLIFTKYRRRRLRDVPAAKPTSYLPSSGIFYIGVLILIGLLLVVSSDLGTTVRKSVSDRFWSVWEQLFYSSTKNK